METAPVHLTWLQLQEGLSHVDASPKDRALLEAIFVRPRPGDRVPLTTVEVSTQRGIAGDRWEVDHWQKLPDGHPDPRSQISLMNSRMLRLIAGTADAMCLAGDNLIVDFDLSETNLPAGARLMIGREVVIEMTDQPHAGCAKFTKPYGQPARAFVNSPDGSQRHLRGRYARIVAGGTIRVGDVVAKC